MISVLSRLKQHLKSLYVSVADNSTAYDFANVKTKWKESMAALKKIRSSAFDYRAEHLHSHLEMYQALNPPQGSDNSVANQKKSDGFFSSWTQNKWDVENFLVLLYLSRFCIASVCLIWPTAGRMVWSLGTSDLETTEKCPFSNWSVISFSMLDLSSLMSSSSRIAWWLYVMCLGMTRLICEQGLVPVHFVIVGEHCNVAKDFSCCYVGREMLDQ